MAAAVRADSPIALPTARQESDEPEVKIAEDEEEPKKAAHPHDRDAKDHKCQPNMPAEHDSAIAGYLTKLATIQSRKLRTAAFSTRLTGD